MPLKLKKQHLTFHLELPLWLAMLCELRPPKTNPFYPKSEHMYLDVDLVRTLDALSFIYPLQ